MDLHFDLLAPHEEMANVLFQRGFVQRRALPMPAAGPIAKPLSAGLASLAPASVEPTRLPLPDTKMLQQAAYEDTYPLSVLVPSYNGPVLLWPKQ